MNKAFLYYVLSHFDFFFRSDINFFNIFSINSFISKAVFEKNLIVCILDYLLSVLS